MTDGPLARVVIAEDEAIVRLDLKEILLSAGYEVVGVSDGTATTGDEWQHAALNYAMTNVGQVASTDEVMSALGATAAA